MSLEETVVLPLSQLPFRNAMWLAVVLSRVNQ